MSLPHVLVVDDNAADANLVRERLKGCVVDHAANFSQALERVRDQAFDAILLDMHLPDGEGPALVGRLRLRAPGAAIVVLSGSMAEASNGRDAIAAGAQDWLAKDHIGSAQLRRSVDYAIERKATERRVAEREERFRQLADTTDSVFWVMSADLGTIIYVNPAFDRLFGTNRDRLYEDATLWRHFVEPEDLDSVVHALEKLASGEAPFDLQYRIRRPDNVRRWVRARGFTLRDPDGRVYRLAGTIDDVSAIRESEERAADATRRLDQILQTAAEGIYGLDRRGVITFANEAAARLLGVPSGEMVNRRAHANHHHTRADGTPHPQEACPIYAVLQDGETRRVDEDVFWTPDGKPIWVSYVTAPMVRNGEIEGAVVVFADVSERHRAREQLLKAHTDLEAAHAQLQEQERFRVQLLNNVAHDMGTPITVLQLRLTMLAQEPAAEDGRRIIGKEAFESLASNVGRLTLLTKDLRDVALMASGNFRLVRARADMTPVLRGVLRDLGEIAAKAEIALRAEIPPGPLVAEADTERATQAVTNLVTNAIKFTPPGGDVLLRARVDDGAVVVEVSDTGPGVPDGARDRLFLPFSQVHQDTDVKKGTGLGLFIVRGILRAHGGEAELLPREAGRGATFRLTFPRAAAAASAPVARQGAAGRT